MTQTVDVLISASSIPAYAHPGDAGADLRSTISLVLEPGERALVPTGVSFAMPDGYVAFVVPRSGLATKHGITVVNAPGTVDAGYRGEVKVTLLNTDKREAYSVNAGDRIAQVIFMQVAQANFIEVAELPGSDRGAGGFGSTGYSAPATETPAAGSDEELKGQKS
ncbi:dUTP diphosphatase [Lysinibacter cavernae]|uniref:Deoxyuridine 5'-triphosphate nucleotidohydrolase n=1 Tax=Lysinibacter cavernae TaxID=1640652 RepID=A0A7X5QZ40_9MICO|nr:dUTP pyrophosphatase [Lysinibacter cavernae]